MHANLQDKTWYGDGVPSGVMDNPVPRGGIYVNLGSGFAYVNNGTLESPNYVPVASAGGGAIPSPLDDNLEAPDYVAVGDDPASAGAVRLSNAAFVTARNGDNDDDFNLIGTEEDDEGDHVVVGDGSVDILFRNYQESVPVVRLHQHFDLYSSLKLRLFGDDYNGASPPTRPVVELSDSGAQLLAAVSTVGSPIADSPPLTLTGTYWNGEFTTEHNASLQHIMLDNDPAVLSYLRFRVGGNNGRFLMTNLGAFTPFTDSTGSLGSSEAKWGNIFAALPTANPNVAGQLWSDSGTVKVSAG